MDPWWCQEAETKTECFTGCSGCSSSTPSPYLACSVKEPVFAEVAAVLRKDIAAITADYVLDVEYARCNVCDQLILDSRQWWTCANCSVPFHRKCKTPSGLLPKAASTYCNECASGFRSCPVCREPLPEDDPETIQCFCCLRHLHRECSGFQDLEFCEECDQLWLLTDHSCGLFHVRGRVRRSIVHVCDECCQKPWAPGPWDRRLEEEVQPIECMDCQVLVDTLHNLRRCEHCFLTFCSGCMDGQPVCALCLLRRTYRTSKANGWLIANGFGDRSQWNRIVAKTFDAFVNQQIDNETFTLYLSRIYVTSDRTKLQNDT